MTIKLNLLILITLSVPRTIKADMYAKSKISNRTKVQNMRETLYGTDN